MKAQVETGRPLDVARIAPDEAAAFEAWGLLLRVHATVAQGLDAVLQRHAGVSLSTYDLLAQVATARDHRIRLRDLEERVLFSQSTVSRLAARLEREGLLERTVPACDRRVLEVRLTAAGAAAFRAARAVAADHLRETFVARLAPGQDVALRDALASVSDPASCDADPCLAAEGAVRNDPPGSGVGRRRREAPTEE